MPPVDSVTVCLSVLTCVCHSGVVSGEAAQRVLTNHSTCFTCTSPPPVMGSQTPPAHPRRSLQTPPVLQRPAVPQRLLSKGLSPSVCECVSSDVMDLVPLHQSLCLCVCLSAGQLKMVSPPDCPVCMSHYKLITDLRGFMCVSVVAPPSLLKL